MPRAIGGRSRAEMGTRTRLNVTEPVQARLAWFEYPRKSRPSRLAGRKRGPANCSIPSARDSGLLDNTSSGGALTERAEPRRTGSEQPVVTYILSMGTRL